MSALPPPSPTSQVVEDHLVAAARRDDLPIAALQRALGPPPVLEQPRFAYRIDVASIHDDGTAVRAGADGHPPRRREATWGAHRRPTVGLAGSVRRGLAVLYRWRV